MQKIIDDTWRTEMSRIYQKYSIYHQSEGTEQTVFDGRSGRCSPRSLRLIEYLQVHAMPPRTGRLLDVGSGNGAFLREFSRSFPLWSLAGTELTDRYRSVIEGIKGVKRLYTCPPEEVPGVFDLVTLVHVLEHIPDPCGLISQLQDKLSPGGWLLLEVPEFLQNPFDLVVADHCTHFTFDTLRSHVQNAGYEINCATADWIPKELTILAQKTDRICNTALDAPLEDTFKPVLKSLRWLDSLREAARNMASTGFGLFGTSIAATWLFTELGGAVEFFVDEDINRAGKRLMGRPIYRPSQVPKGSHVLIVLPPKPGRQILARIAHSGFAFRCYGPPEMPEVSENRSISGSSTQ
ncbi:MAG: class I SAM-dependent methyltransferase [Pseudomonadota bacterium]